MGIKEKLSDYFNVIYYGKGEQPVSILNQGIKRAHIIGRNLVRGEVTLSTEEGRCFTVLGREIGEPIMSRPGSLCFNDGLDLVSQRRKEE